MLPLPPLPRVSSPPPRPPATQPVPTLLLATSAHSLSAARPLPARDPFSLPPRGPRSVCREGRAINTRFRTKEPAAPFCVRALGPPSRYCEVATGVPGRCPAFGDQRAGNNEGYAHARGKCANDLRWPARLVARKPERSPKKRKTVVVLTQNARVCAKCAFSKKDSYSKAFEDNQKTTPSPLVFKKGEICCYGWWFGGPWLGPGRPLKPHKNGHRKVNPRKYLQ